MTLTRVGGKEDGGIDLLGWWWVPCMDSSVEDVEFSARRRVRVVAQCKAERKKIGPKYVRELEGVVYRHMDKSMVPQDAVESGNETQHKSIVALFISESPFTKSALLRAMSSTVPFLLVHIPPMPSNTKLETEMNEIGTVVWNPALGAGSGLLQGKMEVRWTRGLGDTGFPTMWCKGRLVPSINLHVGMSSAFRGSK
ncbi:hypothetical protein V5O48_011666 [Marasmius crinis-equi]|uniref:Restriction endonuclease type IV Mrr domain-containing protein n=1 Tax=Marasmius crinis-equi TaxID=585013 RepID=A0ABR3F4Y4_9AGAR